MIMIINCYTNAVTYTGDDRVSQVPDTSLHTCHVLGPRQTLKELTFIAPLVLASAPKSASPSASSTTYGAEYPSGNAVSPMAYMFPCVRFVYVVRFTSFINATLGTGGWLGLTRRGLAPRKRCQALPGALPFREYYCNPGLPRERSVSTSSPCLCAKHRPKTFLEVPTPGGPLRTNNEPPTLTGS